MFRSSRPRTRSSAAEGFRLSAVLLASAVAPFLASPGTAAAASYRVKPCAAGVTPFPGTTMLGPQDGVTVVDACKAGDGLQLTYTEPGNSIGYGGFAVAVPAAFPNAVLTKVTATILVGAHSSGEIDYGVYDSTSGVFTDRGAWPGGPATATSMNVTIWDGAVADHVRRVFWSARGTTAGVSFKGTPHVVVTDIVANLDDSTLPTAAPVTTGLLDGTPQTGTRTLSVTGSDTDSGVSSIAVGLPGGRTLTSAGTCTYQSVEACQGQLTGTFQIDTTALPAGPNTLPITVTDAAGNVRHATTPSFTVAATPTPTPTPTP
ncbi:MAG: hypothetical protein REI11_14845, partial [Patulibacter sp.]|nr:hypothetical protein [Patulibacter sp.]